MSDRKLRRFSVHLATALLFVACGGDHSEPVRVRAGEIEIAASVTPPALRVGENEMIVALRDANGAPIEDADVAVEVKMGAMGAMPPMGGPASVEALGDGRYRAAFKLEMGGTWQVAIRATSDSAPMAIAEGSLTVGTPGLRLEANATPTQTTHETHEGHASEAAAGSEARSEPKASEVHRDGSAAGDAPSTGASPAPPKTPSPSPDQSAAQQPAARSHPGEFRFDPDRLRQVGIRSEPAKREELDATVRAVGRVVWDESALHDVTMRVAGFAGDVEADALGEAVKQGETLFLFYSPELFAAQREYQDALRAHARARGTSAPERGAGLAAAAERRLRLWGLDGAEIQAIARRGTPQEYLPIRAPVSGYIVEKEIVAGSAIAAGQRLYRIAPLDPLWIDAEVYEAELAQVRVGMPADVTLTHLPGQRFAAKVAYVYPSLQPDRRTARVRLVLANPAGVLRPDMFATVVLRSPLGERLTVRESAVLRAGDRNFVFLDLGDGHLRPQQVETGIESDGRVEITAGLEAGQPVVVAGTFLVAGESRLRAALESW